MKIEEVSHSQSPSGVILGLFVAAHSLLNMLARAFIRTCLHVYVHANVNVYVYACMHAHMRISIDVYIPKHTETLTYMHTNIRLYVHEDTIHKIILTRSLPHFFAKENAIINVAWIT